MKDFIPQIPADGRFPYLTALGIITDIEFALAGDENILAIAIKGAIHRQVKADEIIKTCKDNIRDNYNVMADMLSVKLVERIKAYQLPEPENNLHPLFQQILKPFTG